MRSVAFFLLVVLRLSILLPSRAAGQAAKRAMTPDDLARTERLGGFTLSPDGMTVAYDRNSDVWIKSLKTGTSKPIAQQKDAGIWYLDPGWSPSGRRLAMSTLGSFGRGIAVWDSTTNEVKEILGENVLYQGPYGFGFFEWLDDKRILCAVFSSGDQYYGSGESIAIRGWDKFWKGAAPTASVLESGGGRSDSSQVGSADLLIIDVEKGVVSRYDAGIPAAFSLAPDRKHIAYLRQKLLDKPTPEADLHEKYIFTYDLIVLALDGSAKFQEEYEYSARSAFPHDHPWVEWKSDSRQLVLAASAEQGGRAPLQLYRCRAEWHGCEELSANHTLGPIRDVKWTATGDLVAYAASKGSGQQASETQRLDWWLLEENGATRNLTADVGATKSGGNNQISLISQSTADSVVAFADGEFWKLDLQSGAATKVAIPSVPKFDRVVWSPSWEAGVTNHQEILATVKRDGAGDNLVAIDFASGQMKKLVKPDPSALLRGYSPLNGVGVFAHYDSPGFVGTWFCKEPNGSCEQIAEVNGFLRDIARVESKEIKYRSLDGKELTAVLDLPIGYREGLKYPLITGVYVGGVFGNELFGAPGTEMLTAHGYAVLSPSMPLPPTGTASDPYMEMLNGVIPAVDKAIDLGIADPERLGIMGHSYGGYSVYSIISQTTRFRAAVAMAGPADLVSLYGVFSGGSRYSTTAGSDWAGFFESGQGRMGSPPWNDLARYIRNSPISYVERIEAPLMIVQGDQDFVAIDQGEEMFSAFKRQNKRAEFVRYWGEGHSITSPENKRDLWIRIYAWFDEFLKGPETPRLPPAASQNSE